MLPALIATDVDGTLLDDDERVTDRTRAAVVSGGGLPGVEFVLPPVVLRDGSPIVEQLGFAPMAVCQRRRHLRRRE